MTARERLKKAELLSRYDDAGWRANLLDLLDVSAFLGGCIIRSDYRISDDINQSIFTSEYGDWFVKELGRKQVPIKEARLTCLLEFAHTDLLVKPEAFDRERLAKAIGSQIVKGAILLPFIHGPELYDRAADLFPDRRTNLSITETLRLIGEMPAGVFQSGRWISGPYGLLESSGRRQYPPKRSIPLQHCHDVSCSVVHNTILDTDSSAVINEHRPLVRKILEGENELGSEWGPFVNEIMKGTRGEFDDFNSGTVWLLVGDTLSDHELRCLLSYLMDNSGSVLRKKLEQIEIRGRAEDAVAGLNRAQLLQLVFLADDATLMRALDSLVFSETIRIPESEVRRPMLHRDATRSTFGVRAELSSRGVRVRSTERELGPLRLRRLVDGIYPADDNDACAELDWQLRSVRGASLPGRLDDYLRLAGPDEVVRRLVLARRQNVVIAADQLGLATVTEVEDDILVDRVLWKLGFEVAQSQPVHDEFWQSQERMTQATRSASASAVVENKQIRGLAVDYFVALEKILGDTLGFATWLFTTDHVASRRPFFYVEGRDGDLALSELTKFAARQHRPDEEPLVFDEKSTLFPLCRGFQCLSAYLADMDKRNTEFVRGEDETPEFAGKTELQHFPFVHTSIFLDLVPKAKEELLNTLKEVSRILVAAKVWDVRNELLHFRRSTADIGAVLSCLEAVSRAAKMLEDAGLTRILFFSDRNGVDRWGRKTVLFSDRRGREIAMSQPSSYAWLNLPPLHVPQYLVTCALFDQPNEVIRIRPSAQSEYMQLWENYPRRRESSTAIGDLSAVSGIGSGAEPNAPPRGTS